MKLKIKILLVFVAITKIAFSQAVLNNNVENGVAAIPEESVFVHFNTSLILSGEYFYYSAYCFNNNTKKLSDISKIVYVELIGKDNNVVFKHKIRLEKGRGYSDFFIPVTVTSGSYKLIAYTNWMKNAPINTWFTADINIINPYKTNKATYYNESVDKEFNNSISQSQETNSNNNLIELVTNKDNFKKREKVLLTFKDSSKEILTRNGNYSISIRRKGIIPNPLKLNSIRFLKEILSNKIKATTTNSKIYLPELRGELFRGKVAPKDEKLRVDDLKVAVSIPGEDYIFSILKTNKTGEFFFNIDKYYATDDIYLEVLGDTSKTYDIVLYNQENINVSKLKFEEFKINPIWKNEIVNQSIHNQIESAYFEFKPDSLAPMPSHKLFENRISETYLLDNYTRFPKLKETILEVVKNVFVRKVDKNDYVFEVQGFNFGTNTGISPLVFMDGIAIQNHTFLMDFNAYNISEITLYRDQFVFGLEVFQGAIEIKTVKGSNSDWLLKTSIHKGKMFKPQFNKNYFSQNYSTENKNSRIPDYRQQLLWIPNLEISGINKKELDFYTSDEEGEYEISLEGFTQEGIPISITKKFTVN